MNLAILMINSALGCFKQVSMIELQARFVLDKTERDAASHMVSVVQVAFNHVTTSLYDHFQCGKEGVSYCGGVLTSSFNQVCFP